MYSRALPRAGIDVFISVVKYLCNCSDSMLPLWFFKLHNTASKRKSQTELEKTRRLNRSKRLSDELVKVCVRNWSNLPQNTAEAGQREHIQNGAACFTCKRKLIIKYLSLLIQRKS